jgi:hypothetical protein
MRTAFLIVSMTAVLAEVSGVASAGPVTLSTWTAESYPAVIGFDAGIWTVGVGGPVGERPTDILLQRLCRSAKDHRQISCE